MTMGYSRPLATVPFLLVLVLRVWSQAEDPYKPPMMPPMPGLGSFGGSGPMSGGGPYDGGPPPASYGGDSTCNCLRWTNFISADNPGGQGDYETLGPPDDRGNPGTIHHVRPDICTIPVRLECRTIKTKMPWYLAYEKMTYECDPYKGFACENRKQLHGKCHDYEVRVLCFYSGGDYDCPCLYWTEWYDKDDPPDGGDVELIGLTLPKYVCQGGYEPVDVQCHTVQGHDVYHAGNKKVRCDLQGLSCYNHDQGKNCKCQDYKVRFLCPKFPANYPIAQYDDHHYGHNDTYGGDRGYGEAGGSYGGPPPPSAAYGGSPSNYGSGGFDVRIMNYKPGDTSNGSSAPSKPSSLGGEHATGAAGGYGGPPFNMSLPEFGGGYPESGGYAPPPPPPSRYDSAPKEMYGAGGYPGSDSYGGGPGYGGGSGPPYGGGSGPPYGGGSGPPYGGSPGYSGPPPYGSGPSYGGSQGPPYESGSGPSYGGSQGPPYESGSGPSYGGSQGPPYESGSGSGYGGPPYGGGSGPGYGGPSYGGGPPPPYGGSPPAGYDKDNYVESGYGPKAEPYRDPYGGGGGGYGGKMEYDRCADCVCNSTHCYNSTYSYQQPQPMRPYEKRSDKVEASTVATQPPPPTTLVEIKTPTEDADDDDDEQTNETE